MDQEPRQPSKRFDSIVRILAVFAVFAMLFSFGTAYYVNSRPTPTSVPSPTPIPTGTVSPDFTRTPPPTERTGGALTVYLPGMLPETIRVKFEANQFECDDPELNDDDLYQWDCVNHSTPAEARISVISRSVDTVDQITATIIQPQNPNRSEALRFFGLVAELPYTGAEPAAARDWTELTLLEQLQVLNGEEQRAVFGDVLFRFFGDPSLWTLEMGELPGEDIP